MGNKREGGRGDGGRKSGKEKVREKRERNVVVRERRVGVAAGMERERGGVKS